MICINCWSTGDGEWRFSVVTMTAHRPGNFQSLPATQMHRWIEPKLNWMLKVCSSAAGRSRRRRVRVAIMGRPVTGRDPSQAKSVFRYKSSWNNVVISLFQGLHQRRFSPSSTRQHIQEHVTTCAPHSLSLLWLLLLLLWL